MLLKFVNIFWINLMKRFFKNKKEKESVDKRFLPLYIYIVKQMLTKINKLFQRELGRSERT